MAAEVVASLKQRDVSQALQGVCSRQARDARANNGNPGPGRGAAHSGQGGVCVHQTCPGQQKIAKGPGAKKGGEEEEKNRPRTAVEL
jgi:hypothetical protein